MKHSNSERMKKWRLSLNPEQKEIQAIQSRSRVKQWRIKNPDRRVENLTDAARARKSRWKAANKDKVCSDTQRRNTQKIKAMPVWANEFFISEIYHLSKIRTAATGFPWHVDHIVPVRSPFVCGLHTEHNLRVIPANDNIKKSNKHWPNMWEAA